MIDVPLEDGTVAISGALELERTAAGIRPRRLPRWTRSQLPSEFCDMVVAQPSGVRLELRTSATLLELDVLTTWTWFADAPSPQPPGAFDLLVDGAHTARLTVPAGNMLVLDIEKGGRLTPGDRSTLRFGPLAGGRKDLAIWLPHACQVDLVALRANAPVRGPAPASQRRWVHHGSSISQCCEAEGPLGTWPAVAARRLGLDLLNLGLAGNCMIDPFAARTIRDEPAGLISLELGINIVNGDTMRPRAFGPAVHGFLDTIRDGHPGTPVVVVSPIICPTVEERPGPTLSCWEDGVLTFRAGGERRPDTLTLQAIRSALRDIVGHRVDPGLYYIDGRDLFGESDLADLPDGLHPNAAGYRRMGDRFAGLLTSLGLA